MGSEVATPVATPAPTRMIGVQVFPNGDTTLDSRDTEAVLGGIKIKGTDLCAIVTLSNGLEIEISNSLRHGIGPVTVKLVDPEDGYVLWEDDLRGNRRDED